MRAASNTSGVSSCRLIARSKSSAAAGVRGQHALAAQCPGQRPGLPLGLGGGGELGRDPLRVGHPAQLQVAVDQLSGRGQIRVGDGQVGQQPLLPLEVRDRRGRVTETKLQLAERGRGPDLMQPHAQLVAEPQRFGGTGPAVLLPAAARLQPGQASQAERQLGLLPALPGQRDRLLISRFRDGPAVGGGLVAGDQVERGRQHPDRGVRAGRLQGVFQQRPPGATLAEAQRRDGQPGQQPQVIPHLGGVLGQHDRFVQGVGPGRRVTAENPGHAQGHCGQEAGPYRRAARQAGPRPLGGGQHLGWLPGVEAGDWPLRPAW